jgi:hypothetical protein
VKGRLRLASRSLSTVSGAADTRATGRSAPPSLRLGHTPEPIADGREPEAAVESGALREPAMARPAVARRCLAALWDLNV